MSFSMWIMAWKTTGATTNNSAAAARRPTENSIHNAICPAARIWRETLWRWHTVATDAIARFHEEAAGHCTTPTALPADVLGARTQLLGPLRCVMIAARELTLPEHPGS